MSEDLSKMHFSYYMVLVQKFIILQTLLYAGV